jgi:hypothetical protein
MRLYFLELSTKMYERRIFIAASRYRRSELLRDEANGEVKILKVLRKL